VPIIVPTATWTTSPAPPGVGMCPLTVSACSSDMGSCGSLRRPLPGRTTGEACRRGERPLSTVSAWPGRVDDGTSSSGLSGALANVAQST
jgi:hypothetical protein